MAQFDIEKHLSDGKRLQWVARPDPGESASKVVNEVKQKAMSRFGMDAFFAAWSHVTASNGYITITMTPVM